MATTIGKAYVQIVPTAQGIEGSITKLLGGETASAGSQSGESFGSNMMSKIKSIVAAAGIGALFKQAISEGANLEQSIGGIETLFGESADIMKSYASEAYKTAGLSANDYMEQATSFAASLLQGTGGNTQKAAETANQALIDMADNANKMGTSIESIQNAYQGFAKQNYTMLDNLKLGYGGTKTEMERLLKDATKLSGVKYDISNLDDVYNAIHVVQEEMGITGTTAKEAESTISGSLSQMKASFSNLLANLTLGEDVREPLSQLVSTTSTFLINNLIPAVLNIIGALPESIGHLVVGFFPVLIDQVQSIIDKITDYLDANLGTFMEEGMEILDSIVTGILNALPNLIKSVTTLVTNFMTTIVNNYPSFLQKGYEILQNIIQGIMDNLPNIISAALNMVVTLIGAIVENLPSILATGVQMVGNIITGIINTMPRLWTEVKNAFAAIDWLSLGSNIISGIINGLKNGLSALKEAAMNVARSALNAAKSFLGIASPSKKFMWIGQMTDEGFAKGLSDNSNLITDAMSNITDEMLNPFDTDLAMSYGVNSNGKSDSSNKNSGYTQIINNYSPKALSASEIARQTRNSTKQMALKLSIGG